MNPTPFIRAAAIRAIRTAAQVAIAAIGSAVVLEDVAWPVVASTVGLSVVLSALTSIVTDLPEVPGDE